jgi:hypothetical protein
MSVAGVDRDHRGLGKDDAPAPYIDERISRAEVNRHVAAAKTSEIAKNTHVQIGGSFAGMIPKTIHLSD